MSYILHTYFAGPMGPAPIEYLINTPQDGFYFPHAAPPPPVTIPGVGVPDVPDVPVSQGVPEPGTWLLVGAAVIAFLLGWFKAALISRWRARK